MQNIDSRIKTGRKVYLARIARRLTQEELARRAQLPNGVAVHRLEYGLRFERQEELDRVARAIVGF